MILDTLLVKITGDANGLTSAAREGNSAINSIAATAQKQGGAISTWGSSMVSGFSGTMRSIGTAAVGAMVGVAVTGMNAIIGGISDGIKRADTINNFPKMMSNMGISSDLSAAAIAKVQKSLDGLPTSTDAAVGSIARFTSKNQDISKSTDMFLALNNAILAGGMPMDLQQTALEQLSQSYSKGRMDMMEWRAVQSAMPAQLKQIADSMGMTTDALGEGLRTGEISMDSFMETIMKLNVEGVDGLANFAEQARNSTGGFRTQMTTVTTAIARGWQAVLNAFGSDRFALIIGQLKEVLKGLFDYMVPIAENIGNAVEQVFGPDGVISKGFTNVGDKIVPLLPIIGALAGAFGGLLGQLPIVGSIFQGINPIFGATIGLFAGMYQNSGMLRGAIGELVDVFGGLLGNLSELGDTLGGTLNVALAILGNILAEVVGVVTALVDGFINGLTPGVESLSTSIGPLMQVLQGVGFEIRQVLEKVQPLATELGENLGNAVSAVVGFFGTLVESLNGPLTFAIEAAGGAVGVLGGAFNGILEVGTAIIDFFGKNQMAMDLLVSVVGGAIAVFGIWKASTVLATTAIAIHAIATGTATAAQTGLNVATKLAAVGQAAFNAVMSANPIILVTAAIAALVAGLIWFFTQTETGKQIWADFTAFIGEVWDNLVTGLQETLTSMATFFTGVWQGIVDFVTGIITGIQDFFTGFFTWYADTWSSVWQGVSDFFKGIWDGIKAIVELIMGGIRAFIDAEIRGIQIIWSAIWGAISGLATSIWNGIKNTVSSAINAVSSIVSGVMGTISSVWNSMWSGISGFMGNIWSGITSAVSAAIETVYTTVTGIKDKVTGFFSGAVNWLWDAGSNIINGLLKGIKAGIDGVYNFVSGIGSTIVSLKGPEAYDKALLIKPGEWIMESLNSGIERGLGNVLDKVRTIGPSINSLVADSIDRIDIPMDARVTASSTGLAGSVTHTSGDTVIIEQLNVNKEDLDSGDLPADIDDIIQRHRMGRLVVV